MEGNITLDPRNNYTVHFVIDFNFNYKMRNIILGPLGLLANVLALFVILKSNKVNRGRRLIILNVIISDTIFLVFVCLHGRDNSTKMSGEIGCFVMMLYSITNAMVTVIFHTQLSILNFLALYTPYKYRLLATSKNTGISVSVVWLVGIASSFWCTDLHFPAGRLCVGASMLLRRGAIFGIIMTLLSSTTAIAFNLGVLYQVKNYTWLPAFYKLRFGYDLKRKRTRSKDSAMVKLRMFGAIGRAFNKNQIQPAVPTMGGGDTASSHNTSMMVRDTASSNSSNHTSTMLRYAVITNHTSAMARNYARTKHTASSAATSASQCASCHPDATHHEVNLNDIEHEPPICEHGPRAKPVFTIKQNHATRSTEETTERALTIAEHRQVTSSTENQTSSSSSQRRTTVIPSGTVCKTLAIVTTYTAIMSIPPVVGLAFAITRVGAGHLLMVSPIGLALASSPIVRSIGNALIFVFNFAKADYFFSSCKQNSRQL